jgi:endonuclease/exonuclease/phosphatase family metal-dependent hydrolase
MRFLLYNIRYATGKRCPRFPWSGYLRKTTGHLETITGFVRSLDPDIIGLVEVDSGSYRTNRRNQAREIARALGHYHCYGSKYHHSSMANRLPVLRKQGNAFLTRDTVHGEQFHYFKKGVKRLVIELDLPELTVFLVHLALGFRVRQDQLADLYALVKATQKPHIVAGDFNARWGDREMRLFLAAAGLQSANTAGAPSYPSWSPRRQLDFILYSPGIRVTRFAMPQVTYSDHLPIVCDFEVA